MKAPHPPAKAAAASVSLTRPTPHPCEPTAPCELVMIEGRLHLTGNCPHCKVRIIHEQNNTQPIDGYSRRTCAGCGNSYWIAVADYMLPKYRTTNP